MADLNNLLGNIGSDTEDNNDHHHHHDQSSPSNDGPGGDVAGILDDDGAGGSSSEYEQLKRLWLQELACPELLYYDEELVSHHVELLRRQEDVIEDVLERGVVPASASSRSSGVARRRRGGGGGGDDGEQSEADQMLSSIAASVLRMECDRVRFVLADLARVRLRKIERHALHNRDLLDRMSDEEVNYLQQYGQLIERHFNRTVLNHLPKQPWRNLDGPEMIDRPDLDAFVFCRVNEEIVIPDVGGGGDGDGEEDDILSPSDPQKAGSTLIVRYRSVRNFVLEGKVTLLA